MKLTVVIGVLNQFEISLQTLKFLSQYADNAQDLRVVILDNGSKENFFEYTPQELRNSFGDFTYYRQDKNQGCYPFMFKRGLDEALGVPTSVVAFFHSDLFIVHQGWDTAILAQFDGQPQLGMLGVIGSTQIDSLGGRGLGTHSNFQGGTYQKEDETYWTGSRAEVHGKRDEGMIVDGAVVDGCAMVFRTSVLHQIGFKTEYPLHHFYDRAMSVQVREAGYKVGILGLKVDHISGQTANHEQGYHDTAKEWAKENLGIDTPDQWATLPQNQAWFNNPTNPSKGQIPHGWDHVMYLTAEKLFLEEYRDSKHIIPVNC